MRALKFDTFINGSYGPPIERSPWLKILTARDQHIYVFELAFPLVLNKNNLMKCTQ
ncbi:uncharacterized protein CYBJADRAFT_175942 [Cyberlindnera jadinii NRRL Y-1542]|uniref:Uncharacterized protein n=1 Tax=Cyberlindnera jadinii (strain ATCC 18201 / CBS 1600 / BCRC 20928 / JCM 3617 / NBRC 0987 / NRRL Y-1542) TaxID=983966 RepID=A0A1E4RTG7_CYBJN|nr:hypothetical protein CYBJADRAFT_175942 [Cyberlindnera jadinii NRRL Y-1542]ODV70584.1 hypothetical protein CYBJADRAFT_175942 [Cyberlindnera jadinii NRRL Y-1542]